MASKNELRREIKIILSNLSSVDHELRSSEVSYNLLNFLSQIQENQFPNTIPTFGFYAPIKNEVNILARKLDQEKSFRWAFPYNFSGEMDFRLCSPEKLEESTAFGVTIRSPKELDRIVRPEVLIIPGLAFGTKGQRLGRGKGYYDRYLESFKGLKIGVCYEEQMRSEIPCDEHDQMMDYIVTQNKVYDCKVF
ncbi:MAG: 5-formyltetrahydrofolate cyclo-ligase [Bacteriovoracaceae bacterium]|nr:5-formyltetrahydrofolate cyclo-ligase [Bacteriovoracaceae bacterium]